jgi:hypothetical protein
MDAAAPTLSVHSRQVPGLRAPTEWTAFRSRSPGVTPAGWIDYDAPDELNLLPDTLKVPPKLADIVRWSLQRPAALQASPFETPSTNNGAERQSGLRPAPRSRSRSRDRAETCSIRSDTRSQTSSTFGRAAPKLQKMRNDLIATAASKIAVLKRHEPDGAGASKAPRSAPATPETTKTGECTSCFEELPIGALVRLPCTHHYCKPCLASLVMTALQNESTFPPKCCLSEIPQATIIIPLEKKQQETYKQKAAEYSIPANRRWYGLTLPTKHL